MKKLQLRFYVKFFSRKCTTQNLESNANCDFILTAKKVKCLVVGKLEASFRIEKKENQRNAN